MMLEIVKNIFIYLWGLFSKFLPDTTLKRKIDRKIFMSKLMKKDLVEWRVQKAIDAGAKVGENCKLFSLNMFSEPYLIEIGNNVIVSGNVSFVTHDGGIHLLKKDIPHVIGNFGRIKIGDNCFIGMGAIILLNVSIGNNCIVGAGSVVTKSFPDNSVIMGNPAQVIFKMNMYKKMKINSKYNLTNSKYSTIKEMPYKTKQKLVLEKFNSIDKASSSK